MLFAFLCRNWQAPESFSERGTRIDLVLLGLLLVDKVFVIEIRDLTSLVEVGLSLDNKIEVVITCIVLAYCAYLYISHSISIRNFFEPNTAFLSLLFMWFGFTSVWSIDPAMTVFRSAQLAGVWVLAIRVFRSPMARSRLVVLLLFCTATSVLSKVWFDYKDGVASIISFKDTETSTIVAALGLLTLDRLLSRPPRTRDYALLGVSVFLLFAFDSTASFIASLAAIVVYLFVRLIDRTNTSTRPLKRYASVLAVCLLSVSGYQLMIHVVRAATEPPRSAIAVQRVRTTVPEPAVTLQGQVLTDQQRKVIAKRREQLGIYQWRSRPYWQTRAGIYQRRAFINQRGLESSAQPPTLDPLRPLPLEFGKSPKDYRTLTGRIPLWNLILDDLDSQPLGFGFGTDRLIAVRDSSNRIGWEPLHAHNGFLSAAWSGGYVAIVLLVASVGRVTLNTRVFRLRSRSLPLGLLALLVVNNMSTITFGGIISGSWLIFMCLLGGGISTLVSSRSDSIENVS